MFVVNWLQTVLPKTKGVNMYVVDCKIELLLANDSSILQSTTYIFTPFVFGNTVCSQLTTNIHWPCFCNVYVYVRMFVVNCLQTVLPKTKGVNMYVVDCKIEESLADTNINIDITKTRWVNVCS
jgi:hypothetical protein